MVDAAGPANALVLGTPAEGALHEAAHDVATFIERALEIGGVPAHIGADDHDQTDDENTPADSMGADGGDANTPASSPYDSD